MNDLNSSERGVLQQKSKCDIIYYIDGQGEDVLTKMVVSQIKLFQILKKEKEKKRERIVSVD